MESAIETGSPGITVDRSCIEKLSDGFPGASPLRVAITVSVDREGWTHKEEQTLIEFGTTHEALFRTTLPLECQDHVRLANADHSIDLQGTVTAVQNQNDRKAVAVRFHGTMRHWTKQR